MELRYRLLNVFGIEGRRLSGNPLCVFEDGSSLTTDEMQALARQFNLSETTFIVPADVAEADAQVRIFTPCFEIPFAGHPSLGTAHVVRSLSARDGRVVLQMKGGLVEVTNVGDRATLQVPRPPRTRAPKATRPEIAQLLGVTPGVVAEAPLFVDTGSEQLVVPLRTPADVKAAHPNADLLARFGTGEGVEEAQALAWAYDGRGGVFARFFFLVNGSLVEDPATGSACANLGGWLLAHGTTSLPFAIDVHQGEGLERPSLLGLRVDERKRIFVTGAVVELGTGTIRI